MCNVVSTDVLQLHDEFNILPPYINVSSSLQSAFYPFFSRSCPTPEPAGDLLRCHSPKIGSTMAQEGFTPWPVQGPQPTRSPANQRWPYPVDMERDRRDSATAGFAEILSGYPQLTRLDDRRCAGENIGDSVVFLSVGCVFSSPLHHHTATRAS